MKQWLIFFMIAVLCLTLTGCSRSGTSGEVGTSAPPLEERTSDAPQTGAPDADETSADSSDTTADAQTGQAAQPDEESEPQSESAAPQPTTAPSTTARPETGEQESRTIRVTLTVDCRTATEAGNEIACEVAPDGIMLDGQSVELERDATVLDLLRKSGLVLGVSDSAYGSYVYSIQSLAQGDAGNASGWLFFINGESPQQACSACKLSDGDVVRWVYTCDGGADIG